MTIQFACLDLECPSDARNYNRNDAPATEINASSAEVLISRGVEEGG